MGNDPLYDDGTHGDLLAGDGVFTLDYAIAKAAGYYEWKVFSCGTWDGYPGEGNNKWLYTTANPETVKFTLDTNLVSDGYKPSNYLTNVSDSASALSNTWTAVGDWQGWANGNAATLMQVIAPGLYAVTYTIPAAGAYLYKVTETGSWAHQFGPDGRSIDSGNFNFDNHHAQSSGRLLCRYRAQPCIAAVPASTPGTANWCVAGSFQPGGGWDNASTPLYDDGTRGDLVAGDGTYSLDYAIAKTAGYYEWKIFSRGTGNGYPGEGNNKWLYTTSPTPKPSSSCSIPAQWTTAISLPPTSPTSLTRPVKADSHVDSRGRLARLESELSDHHHEDGRARSASRDLYGADCWCLSIQGHRNRLLGASIRPRWALDRFWQEQLPNLLGRSAGCFLCHSVRGRVKVVSIKTTAFQDNNIWLDDLGHDSRDSVYRNPGDAVTTGTPVTLRLRAANGDLTARKCACTTIAPTNNRCSI